MKIISTLLYRLTANRPARLIKLNNKPYLERYFVARLFGVTLYLHRFVSSDRERHLHNHPWTWSRSLVLSGGYDEEVVLDLTTASASGCVTASRRVKWFNRVDGSHFHRIANAAPHTWTLFMHSARQQVMRQNPAGFGPEFTLKGWGFLELAYVNNEPAVVYRPHESAHTDWHRTAPKGRDIGREPLL